MYIVIQFFIFQYNNFLSNFGFKQLYNGCKSYERNINLVVFVEMMDTVNFKTW